MMQACAKDILPFNQFFESVHCVETDPPAHEKNTSMTRLEESIKRGYDHDLLPALYSCQCNIPRFDKIERCMLIEDGKRRGDQLLKNMGDLTKALNPKATSIPWLTLNGVSIFLRILLKIEKMNS